MGSVVGATLALRSPHSGRLGRASGLPRRDVGGIDAQGLAKSLPFGSNRSDDDLVMGQHLLDYLVRTFRTDWLDRYYWNPWSISL